MFNNFLFFTKNRAVYGKMREKCGRAREAGDNNIIRRMSFACWITKATHTHAHTHTHTRKYVTRIVVPLQQQKWFRKRVSVLRYTYIACLGMTSQGAGQHTS
jgi:hypothetical protein